MRKNSRVAIFNHQGLIGSGLLNYLKRKGFKSISLSAKPLTALCARAEAESFFRRNKPEYCFLPSVKEGGILANTRYPADLIYENLSVQANIIHAAFRYNVKRLIFFASSCCYPRQCPQPMREEYLLTGRLEPSSEAYSVAKLSGIKMCQAYNRQYGTRFISVIPATAFGPGDSFDPDNSHVISALIRKIHAAKSRGRKEAVIWGTGKPRREFIYVDDLASAAVFLLDNDPGVELINIGTGSDVSIKRLAGIIKDVVGFKGKLKFDTAMPDGVYRKLLDSRRIIEMGWRPGFTLEEGIGVAYEWYVSNYNGG